MGANDQQIWRKSVNASGVRSETGSSHKQGVGNTSGSIKSTSVVSSHLSSQKKTSGLGGANFGVSPSHFDLKANVKSPETLPKALRSTKVKKRKLNMKGSLLDDIRVDDTGKHFLPSSGYESPQKQRPSKTGEIKDFISNTIPKKIVNLIANTASPLHSQRA